MSKYDDYVNKTVYQFQICHALSGTDVSLTNENVRNSVFKTWLIFLLNTAFILYKNENASAATNLSLKQHLTFANSLILKEHIWIKDHLSLLHSTEADKK